MSTPTNSARDEEALVKQNANNDKQRTLQEGRPDNNRDVERVKPVYPQWPTSHRGPTSTTPPPGQRAINAIRPEQVVEVGYNQVTGEPSTNDPRRAFPDAAKGPAGTDQQETAQDVLKRGKERL